MAEFPVTPVSPGSEPARHYDTVVEAWGDLLQEDLHYGFFHRGDEALVAATDELTNQMLRRAGLQGGLHVLDVGCGTGKAACRMAAEFSARVTGISPSAVCVARAQALAERLGCADLATFCDGDGSSMNHADETFDRVWVMESSHLIPDKPALLAECARVLRPGGRVVLCDIVLKRKLALEEVIKYRDEFLLLRDVYGRAIMEPLDFYRGRFEAGGLHVDDQSDITKETSPTFDRWRQNANRNRESVIAKIGEEAWRKFLLSCDLLEQFWRDNILGYGIISAHKPA